MKKKLITKLAILFFLLGIGVKGMGANLMSENIQSWTNQLSYGSYTQAISAGTISMTSCIVANGASATGTCSAGRVQLEATNGILELPTLTSLGIAEFHLAAGSANRTIKLQKWNGSSWVDLTTFNGIGTTGATFVYNANMPSSTLIRLASPSDAIYVHDIIITDYTIPPSINLADNGTQVLASNVNTGTITHVLHKLALAVTTANASIIGMTCLTTGSYAAADITNLKAWYSNDATLDANDAILSTYTNPGAAGAKTFPNFPSQNINAGSTGYIFITADINNGATPSKTISVDALTPSNLTFTFGNITGSTSAGGTQTISVLAQPTNHPISFAANTGATTFSSITLNWNDNDGTQAATAYLIKGSSVGYGSITAPTDGVTQTDALLVKNIADGVQTVTFTGLSTSTTYYFKIWPYTNSSSNIDYKTDESIQQTSETAFTNSLPLAWINEFHYDNASNDVNEFVEIALKNAGSYTLSNFTVSLYNGVGGVVYDTKTLNNFTVGTTTNGITLYHYIYPTDGIQNGAQDGIALSYNDGAKTIYLLEFISYEGNFTATNGPAAGANSVDVLVTEPGTASATSVSRVGPNYTGGWEVATTPTAGTNNITIGGGSQVLPIDLISFTGTYKNGVIQLQWTTASEHNNDYFSLQRSTDNKTFESIAEIKGAGESYSIQNYFYNDFVQTLNSSFYYRLQQTDFDGKSSMSSVIFISNKENGSTVTWNTEMNVLHLNINTLYAQNAQLRLYATDGRLIIDNELEINSGNQQYSINLPKGASGIYLMQLILDDEKIMEKIFIP